MLEPKPESTECARRATARDQTTPLSGVHAGTGVVARLVRSVASIVSLTAVALVCGVGLMGCNTLAELEEGDTRRDTGTEDTSTEDTGLADVDAQDTADAAPMGCEELTGGLTLPVELPRAGGEFPTAVDDGSGEVSFDQMTELVDLGLVQGVQGDVVGVDALETAQDRFIVGIVQQLNGQITVTVREYRTDTEPPGPSGDPTSLPPITVEAPANGLFDQVAGFSILPLAPDDTPAAVLVLQNTDIHVFELDGGDAWELAEPVSSQAMPRLTTQYAQASAATSFRQGSGLVLTVLDVNNIITNANGGMAESNLAVVGRLERRASDGVVTFAFTEHVRQPTSPAVPPVKHIQNERLDKHIDPNIVGESQAVFAPGIEVDLNYAKSDGMGGEVMCGFWQLLLDPSCAFRMTHLRSSLDAFVLQSTTFEPAGIMTGPVDSLTLTARKGGDPGTQPAWQQAREAARTAVEEQAGTSIPDEKIGTIHIASASVGSDIVTVSVPVFFGCINESDGTLRPCAPGEHETFAPLPVGSVLTTWTYSVGSAPEPIGATRIEDLLVLSAAPLDVRELPGGRDANPTFALLVATPINPGELGLSVLILASEVPCPLALLQGVGEIPNGKLSRVRARAEGSLLFFSESASTMRAYAFRPAQ